jgi:ATP-dependent helicase/nuclease subunit B
MAGQSGKIDKADILEQAISCQARAVVLTGPACCGKTSTVLNFYRHWNDLSSAGRCVILAPNIQAANFLKRRLIETSGRGVEISPQVMTFAGLSGRIVAAASPQARPIAAISRHVLLRKIVASLAKAGKIPALAGVADTPGLYLALDRAIAELKRSAVDPSHLERSLAQGAGRAQRLIDLLAIYQAYQEQLRKQNLYDVEGLAWLARESLLHQHDKSPIELGLGPMRALSADGFTDFTPTQLEILKLLSPQLEKILITLPLGQDDRSRLWQWSSRTLHAITAAFGSAAEHIHIDTCVDGRPALACSWDKVFDTSCQTAQVPVGFAVIAACGIEAEVTAVARLIKKQLLHSPACPGQPAMRIAVLARSLDAYQPVIHRIFAKYGIAIPGQSQALSDVPIVSFVLATACLAPEFNYRSVLKVIKSSYFDPSALGDFSGDALATAEWIIRRGNVLAGRASYDQAAARLLAQAARNAGQAGDDNDDNDDEYENSAAGLAVFGPAQIQAGNAMLQQLFALCESCDAGRLIKSLRLRRTASRHSQAEIIARDLLALDQLERALAEVGQGGGDQAVGLSLNTDELRELLSAVSMPAQRTSASVDVLDVLSARAIRYDHVYLMGCSEGQFPQQLAEGSLLSEADKAQLGQAGLQLDSQSDLLAREMLLFYLGISRASRQLTASYLQSDGGGKVQGPGSFLLHLLDLHAGLDALVQQGKVTIIPPGDFTPRVDDLENILCADDAFNAAFAGFFQQPSARHDMLIFSAGLMPQRVTRAASGIWARHKRWLAGACNEFDGRLDNQSLLDVLTRRFGQAGQCVFSASQLDTFGQCPWRFFAQYVLGLVPLDEPQRQLQAIGAGIFCHNVLYDLMTDLAKRHGRPVRLHQTSLDELASLLNDAIEAQSAKVEAQHPPYPILWQIQKRQMSEHLMQYLGQMHKSSAVLAGSLHFELTFGLEDKGYQPRDPSSVDTSITIDTPAGPIALRGRVDRVDQIEVDGKTSLMIVDYKTGRLSSPGDITAGRNLQLPLYSMAVEKLLQRHCIGGSFHQIGAQAGKVVNFWPYAIKDGLLKPNDKFADQWERALAVLGRNIQAIRLGQFDLQPTHKCPSYCPMRLICQFSPARSLAKSPPANQQEACQ